MANITFYNSFKEFMADGTIDLDTDDFRIILLTDSYTFDATHSKKLQTSVSGAQLGTGSGYTQNCTSISATWTNSSGVLKWDGTDPTWTASGGAISASHAVIYSDTSTSKKLVCHISLGAQSAGDGTDFKITFNTSGIFELSG